MPLPGEQKKKKSNRRLQRKRSNVSGMMRKSEADMWEMYTGAFDEDERYTNPGWKGLITQALQRRVGKLLTAKQRKKGGAEKTAHRLLDHWVYTRTLAFDSDSNRMGIQPHNHMQISEEALGELNDE